jgi:hypothetical protein
MRGKDLYQRMVNAPRQETAGAALHIITAAQNNASPAAQVPAVCAAFLLLCEGKGIDPQDAFTITKNLINGHDTHLGTDFEAIRLYVRNEL